MASSSNSTSTTSSSFANYPYPTEFNVLDFVPKDLSFRNYDKWQKLMLDFIESRGLIGFIDGTVEEPPRKVDSVESSSYDAAAADTNEEHCMSWKRSNNLVRGWILATLTEDTRLQVLRFKTAKDVWTRLDQIFDDSGTYEGTELEKTVPHYVPLYKATINGDWDSANQIIADEIAAGTHAVRARIAINGETALMLAVKTTSSVQSNDFVRKLLEKMSEEDIALCDYLGRTALHYAASFGSIDGVKMLVNKNSDLPNVLDDKRHTALTYAAARRKREIALYLWETTKDDIKFMDDVCAQLLSQLTISEFYDMALTLLKLKPDLAARMEPSLFELIAEKRSSFRSGTSLNFWQRIVYLGVPMKSESIANSHSGVGDLENPTNSSNTSVRQRLLLMFWEVAEKLVSEIKRVRETKKTHHHALKLLKSLCTEIAKEASLSQVEKIFKPALHKAAYVGIPEVVEEIIVSYPMVLYIKIFQGLSIFQGAITWRRERVFNLIYQLNNAHGFLSKRDNSGNNGLHFAGRLGHQQQINLRASGLGPVLQMQRELQWFKEVEKLSLPNLKEERNNEKMTPAEVFTETHQELMREGERWMKDTATSCTIVAALIATMVFTAAITVPGGNSNDSGQPLLSKQNAFAVFGISDAIALFSSITSVLMFLLILTSRYLEEDFFYILPKRLVIGLVTLFVSILSMMVAFGAILYLVFGNNTAWILIPVVALAGIPVTLFGALQFPLLVEMIQSTYGRGVFGKQSDRALE